MAYGVSWAFTREWMGDYQAGYMPPPPDFPVARAVAASACFPPLFGPLRLRLDPDALKGGSAPHGPQRDECLSDLRLTDGGDYDNMGLEPVWKSHAVVLVSDAGGLFTHQSDRGPLWRVPRYQAIQERQARGLRKRWLIASFSAGALDGTYWGVGGATSHYDAAAPGYSPALSREVIAEIRTDLDAFSDAEAQVLENHGYLLADAALRRHVPSLLPDPVPATPVSASALVPAGGRRGCRPIGARGQREAEDLGERLAMDDDSPGSRCDRGPRCGARRPRVLDLGNGDGADGLVLPGPRGPGQPRLPRGRAHPVAALRLVPDLARRLAHAVPDPAGLHGDLLVEARDRYAAAVALWWAGENLVDMAPYVADARALQLVLLGGHTGAEVEGHDWEAILGALGWLHLRRGPRARLPPRSASR